MKGWRRGKQCKYSTYIYETKIIIKPNQIKPKQQQTDLDRAQIVKYKNI